MIKLHRIKEAGRSTLEMLGVLAIGGLLIIGSVWGISILLNNHRANAILADVATYHMTLEALKEKFDEFGDAVHTDFKPEAPVYKYDAHTTGEEFWFITVEGVPRKVCETLLGRATIKRGNYRLADYILGFYDEETLFRLYKGNIAECEEENVLTFFIGDNVCDGECPEGTTCYFGACCEYGLRCGSNCCEPGQDCCAGECIEKVQCPENQRYDSNACECRCGKDAAGMRLESDGKGGCKCPTDSNGRRMSLVNGYCTCVDAGFTVVGGSCKKMDCRNGSTGNTFQCYINNLSCGWNCDSTGHNCGIGICHASDCRPGEEFVQKNVTGNGGYNYSCKRVIRQGYICYSSWRASSRYVCYKNDQYCCTTTNMATFECTMGLCQDEKNCTRLKRGATLNNDYCVFSDDLRCQYVNGVWECFKYGYYCGDCSDNDVSSGNCCTGTTCKVSKDIVGEYNSATKECEYQVGEEKVTCTTMQGGYYQSCYSNGVKKCNIYTPKGYRFSANYAGGRCPEVAANCPEGTEYDLVQGGVYDCKNQTPNAPVCRYGDNRISCYYNGQLCGDTCRDYFGNGCQKVYMAQCASEGHCSQNGQDITLNPCVCDGAVSSGLVTVKDENGNDIEEYHEFCCPAGHTYTNRACAII